VKTRQSVASLYEPLDFFQLRAPLLPVEAYLELCQRGVSIAAGLHQDGDAKGLTTPERDVQSLLSANPLVRRALAVGSLTLVEALERTLPSSHAAAHTRSRLLRYLIRMSTRPTPFGLFAGVALGYWGSTSDLTLTGRTHTRTRPDMEWLMTFILKVESRPEVRRHLKVFANSAAFIQSGRVFLAEHAPTLGTGHAGAVSVRATGVAKRVLAAARTPITWQDLSNYVVMSTAGATPEKVEKLLDELWQQTLLLTELRPPLTIGDPARYVTDRLTAIPAAAESLSELESLLGKARDWDHAPAEGSSDVYRELVRQARLVHNPDSNTPFQVDTAFALGGTRIARAVGEEVARAGELLLRITPMPAGLPHIHAYRRAFEARYGHGRQVPLLELLDPGVGLGPPPTYHSSRYPVAGEVNPAQAASRAETLLGLACRALRDRCPVVELDPETLRRLETGDPYRSHTPVSLDLYAFVASRSLQEIDKGNFKVVVGPNLGAMAAGRSFGRFGDLLGTEALGALAHVARVEESLEPNKLWAELVYFPKRFRSANVAVRPAVRSYEIVFGTSAGVASSNVIPINELLIGVRDGRFYIRWLAADADVIVCTGHMLNNVRAPVACRLLSDLGRDRVAQLSSFGWGPASSFPFLPRVEIGRIVLGLARWRIDTRTRATELSCYNSDGFFAALASWRAAWSAPQHVYLCSNDQRLLLDLEEPTHAEELRTAIRALREGTNLVLEEVFPTLGETWVEAPDGHYMTELVVSLVRRKQSSPGATPRPARHPKTNEPKTVIALPQLAVCSGTTEMEIEDRKCGSATMREEAAGERLRPPGSEWLFLKLYCIRTLEEDLIIDHIRRFATGILASGLARQWFFLRYSDPDPHIRVRFLGQPDAVARELMPSISSWAAELMARGSCLRFSFDTYDREFERYGGPSGMIVAESIFHVDSHTTAALLHLGQSKTFSMDRTMLAVLTVDTLLAGLGVEERSRLDWYSKQLSSRRDASMEYRNRKAVLRPLLSDAERLKMEPSGEALSVILRSFHEDLQPLGRHLSMLANRGALSRSIELLYGSLVHLHLNRLGIETTGEREILGLLWRVRRGLACCDSPKIDHVRV
jgi:class I lanthipeptide synthase